jgi:hypothetical protein
MVEHDYNRFIRVQGAKLEIVRRTLVEVAVLLSDTQACMDVNGGGRTNRRTTDLRNTARAWRSRNL